jgi:hypothetical protein
MTSNVILGRKGMGTPSASCSIFASALQTSAWVALVKRSSVQRQGWGIPLLAGL